MTHEYHDVLQRLSSAIPEFRLEIADHLDFYDEALPHVLYGDLTRFVLAAHARRDDALVDRCLTFLNAELRKGDKATQELVAVSFVENVGPSDETMRPFIRAWPRALKAAAGRAGR